MGCLFIVEDKLDQESLKHSNHVREPSLIESFVFCFISVMFPGYFVPFQFNLLKNEKEMYDPGKEVGLT